MRFGHEKLTWATRLLILVNVAVFAGMMLIDLLTALVGLPGNALFFEYGAFSILLTERGYLWTPITYLFIHDGLSHVFFNMLMLYFFGPDVERVLGSRQFLRFFLLCGAVGVFANYIPHLFAPADQPLFVATVVGASGAVLGVLIAFAMIDPERQMFVIPLPFPINARAVVMLVIFMNIMATLNPLSNESVATHFGGMAFGYAYMKCVPLLRKYWAARMLARKKPSRPLDDKMSKLGDEIDNIFKFQDRDRRK